MTTTVSSKKIQQEKKEIQQAARAGTARVEVCGHCGQKIVTSLTGAGWYHFRYQQVQWLSMTEMSRYCTTPINRAYGTAEAKRELRSRLPPKAKATPKWALDAWYEAQSNVAMEELQAIHDELKRIVS